MLLWPIFCQSHTNFINVHTVYASEICAHLTKNLLTKSSTKRFREYIKKKRRESVFWTSSSSFFNRVKLTYDKGYEQVAKRIENIRLTEVVSGAVGSKPCGQESLMFLNSEPREVVASSVSGIS